MSKRGKGGTVAEGKRKKRKKREKKEKKGKTRRVERGESGTAEKWWRKGGRRGYGETKGVTSMEKRGASNPREIKSGAFIVG